MAVTITPQSAGTAAATSLFHSPTTGDDPTNIEADVLPVLIYVFTEAAGDQDFRVATQGSLEEPPYDVSTLTNPITVSGGASDSFQLMVPPKLSEHLVDRNVSPPIIQLTGADLTNCAVVAIKFPL